jgi:hypothetical protein
MTYLLQRKFLPINRAHLIKLFLAALRTFFCIASAMLDFALTWYFVGILCASVEQKSCLKSEKVFDIAEILSDPSRTQKHGYVLVFVAGFCLCFCSSLSIMLRDLQDALAIAPKSVIFVNAGAHS